MDKYRPRTMLQFEVQLAEHCNLNCRGCDHFSPIAEPGFLDLDEYARDLARLSELFEGACRRIYLLGGEPLLHPGIVKAMGLTRQYFPQGRVIIVTNGLLLERMPDEFWQTCREKDIGILATKYPVHCDYDACREKAAAEKVDFGFFNDGQRVKTLNRMSLSVAGHEQARTSFEQCYAGNQCINLRHGRIYTCSMATYAHHLIQKYDLPMHASKRDSIDIYKAASAEEILAYCAKPIPFCRYCILGSRRNGEPYRQSGRDRYEWLEFEGSRADWEYMRQFEEIYICTDGDTGTELAALAKEHGLGTQILRDSAAVERVGDDSSEKAFLLCYRDKGKRRQTEKVLWACKAAHMIPVYQPPDGVFN